MKVTVTVRVGSHLIPKPNPSQGRRASRKQRQIQQRAELESASFAQVSAMISARVRDRVRPRLGLALTTTLGLP